MDSLHPVVRLQSDSALSPGSVYRDLAPSAITSELPTIRPELRLSSA